MAADPLAFYQIYQRYMQNVFATKSRLSLMKYYLNINVGFTIDLMRNNKTIEKYK